MPPQIALVVWSILLVVFVRYDSNKDSKPSLVLWVPVLWLFLMGSRTPAQWLGGGPTMVADAFMEGSPLDRTVYLVLMGLAIVTLANRHVDWAKLLWRNFALVMFLFVALASVLWSDFPGITFKRWFRDVGMYLMVVLVLSQPRPLDAVCTVIRRSTYLLLFLSVVLIKYYTWMGVYYNEYSGAPEYVGATTSKNMLGVVCLIAGIFYFWDTLRRWPERRLPGTKAVLLENVALIAMTLWLLKLSSSATSTACLAIGCAVVVLLRGKWATAHPVAATALIPVTLATYVVLELAFDLSDNVALLLGRDPSLTGRTGIWTTLLGVGTNPIVGVGYQSFWLGDRLRSVWDSLSTSFLNEAHNGYLEIYLSLGAVGLTLIALIMVSSYWTITRQLKASPTYASLGLSLWSVMIVYNVTESAFAASLLWTVFLLCCLVVPRAEARAFVQTTEELPNTRRAIQFRRPAGVAGTGRVSRGTRQAHLRGAGRAGR